MKSFVNVLLVFTINFCFVLFLFFIFLYLFIFLILEKMLIKKKKKPENHLEERSLPHLNVSPTWAVNTLSKLR